MSMPGHPAALFSGLGRQVAGAALACGIVILTLGLLLQAGKQQRHYRDQHQQQLRQAAVQLAQLTSARIDAAALLLRASGPPALSRRAFSSLQPVASGAAALRAAGLDSSLSELERQAIEGGGTVLFGAAQADGSGSLYLLRTNPRGQWLLAQLRDSWLWPDDGGSLRRYSLIDAASRLRFGAPSDVTDIAGHVAAGLDSLPLRGAGDLAWTQGGSAWVGAMAHVSGSNVTTGGTLALVVMEPDRPWSVAFFSALRTQATLLLPLLLLAAWFGWHYGAPQLRTLRQLRRALLQLPDRRVPVAAEPGITPELRQLVEAFGRSAAGIEAQQAMRKLLDEIDALLLSGGDCESAIDQVLGRVRAAAQADNVGLTLVDPGAGMHGRLFVVSARGGAPVNRVGLDANMAATLRESDGGLTIARCEQGRHSFLAPLQAAGSDFFWVWPVMAADELAAILALGYAEPPPHAARIAETGQLCAQHLGLALSSNARAERLYRQANYDPLTQLPNRQLFHAELQQELGKELPGALLYIDLDHFKRVNDSLGHEAGDRLLAVVAQRLRGAVRGSDTVARLAGDEFTVILREIGQLADVVAVADNIVGAMRTPVRLGGRDHYVHASIGIARFPADGVAPDELLHRADLAMYRAKDVGRGAAVCYELQMEAPGHAATDSGLFNAMKRRELSLYYQPQYRVADGQLVGMEALLRWSKPRHGMQDPAQFIPAAEQSGIIVDIGGWVIEAACTQLARWRDAGLGAPRVAVNLSRQQLRDHGLVATLQRQMQLHDIDSSQLCFEMNEAALADADSADNVRELAALGVELVLDDFGTGSTALATLRHHPVGAVKIDRSFVEKLGEDPAAAALADTIIVMAHGLDRSVIAEGVETVEQYEYLRERGCDVAQGYFLAQPLSAQDMTSLLAGRLVASPLEQSARA
jgi:diguanylate cyclase (GGDEF)-like protein